MSCWELDNPCGQDVFKIFKLQEKLQLEHTIKHAGMQSLLEL